MPIHEFRCPSGHMSERLFKSFREAEGVIHTTCPECGDDAVKVAFSTPFPAHFYGNPDGYHKPSPLNRYSTKLAAQKGNEHSMG